MNPDTTGSEPILTRFLRRLYQAQSRQAEHDKRRHDHEPRNGAAKRKAKRRIAEASRRRNRH